MPRDSRSREAKVGALVLVALVILAALVFFIGEKNNLFRRKNHYSVRFVTANGLAPGNPVQLSGITCGSVDRVVLPEDPEQRTIRVEISVDRRFAERVRADSLARIKTLGLLGDKYIEITSGSPDRAVIPSGSEIPAAEAAALDQFVESGEDVMSNVTEISSSLKTILARMEAGEGLLGELVSDAEAGKKVTDAIVETMESVQTAARRVQSGDGIVPRLLSDAELADELIGSVRRLDGVLASVQEGEGLVGSLLNDPSSKEDFQETLAALKNASTELAAFSAELGEGDGMLPRLLNDEEYGQELMDNLTATSQRLNELSAKLAEGDGTVAQLVNDPQIYEALNDVVVGVNESKLLRWLIRNRQKAGIKKRYNDAQAAVPDGSAPPEPENP